MDASHTPSFLFQPVTQARLCDLQAFSQAHGKFRYCSCMRWRLASADFQRSSKEERIAALEELVSRNVPVGVLAYQDEEPVGWCSIAPRTTYTALERSRTLPRIDDAAVWSVVCFFVDRRLRGQGLTSGLLYAALDYARAQGASIVEAYPVDPQATSYTYMGAPATFLRGGFRDVTPPGQKRLILRVHLD